MEEYINRIRNLNNPTFQQIRSIANKSISHLSEVEREKLYDELNHGVNILNTHEQLCQYLYSYGNMHEAKIHYAVKSLPNSLFNQQFDIVDWGCGQGLATICFFDYLNNDLDNSIDSVVLIEPSKPALERAKLHVSTYISSNKISTINKYFEKVSSNEITSNNENPVIHFFSNILDIKEIDLKDLATKLNNSVLNDNYIVTVGPLNHTNKRIDWFYVYFQNTDLLHNEENSKFPIRENNYKTYKAKVYKLEYSEQGNLIPIEYYPPVQFHAGYQLDIVKELLKEQPDYLEVYNRLLFFETATPFDIGASVYDDIDPVLAVLNNIVTRGLPTKASVYIEKIFEEKFNCSQQDIQNGEIKFIKKEQIDISQTLSKTLQPFNELSFNSDDLINLQLVYSPIVIARIKKVILEAMMTDRLDFIKNEWDILVEEKDIPGAAIAFEDLKQMFDNLCALSEDFNNRKFPKLNIVIISNKLFRNSPLHLDNMVIAEPTKNILSKEYDLVIDIAVFEESNIKEVSFSRYSTKNKSYFNIRSAKQKRKERSIYTTDLITYKDIVQTDVLGRYNEIEETKSISTYFLQLLFRKEAFRSGQLPILHRALKNKSVIGLLPTGGGKSLTYQLAALLQPGVTLIVDPLRSLMKDQYDGLITAGIDVCAYINSSLSKEEREKAENNMEQSKLLFVFMSPERLAIYKFRERLKNMHELNVYFSYGVIDEVHCVSEWGHDFRFSYLHLGRNLYNYVKAKKGNISLFGLTATASFDVLADVERELSGNGAFPLDAETIVRYENTNRLELQYKIEKINVEFENEVTALKKKKKIKKGIIEKLEKKYNQLTKNNLPIPIQISDKWTFYDHKKDFLFAYLKKIPEYIREIQTEETVEKIKKSFIERTNTQDETEIREIENASLDIEMPDNYYLKRDIYKQAGIVFCPHKNSTGISVNSNVSKVKSFIPDVGKFYGGDDDGNLSMQNLEYFRDNKQPLMIATKAFGMGIDKPNVRFTTNLNYSSSLESFVQEAGRAGRDRKMALSVIFISDYKLVRISRKYTDSTFPLGIIKGKWFTPDDLDIILNHYNLTVDDTYLDYLTPEKDVVRLFCNEGTIPKYFSFNKCTDKACPVFKNCKLRKVPDEATNWQYEKDILEILKNKNLVIPKKYFQFQNADYDTVMYFYNNNFKGAVTEKRFMVNLLLKDRINGFWGNDIEKKEKLFAANGFLDTLSNAEIDTEIVLLVDYTEANYPDIAKAIYRMTSIGLIEDFTQNYIDNQFRIVTKRYKEGHYFDKLKDYLMRYYTLDRAEQEVEKTKLIVITDTGDEIKNEIYKCLAYLTDFVYDKISVKRKRAIDDMRTFCLIGIEETIDWKEKNEELKDFIYYYFNSKYAKSDYVAENGEPYSLTVDTDFGKISDIKILFKYLKVVDEEIVGVGTDIDNVKHLQGAVRLIRRSLTDDNPTISLLNAFCLAYLGTHNNENLEQELERSYKEGLVGFYERMENKIPFWDIVFAPYNTIIANYISQEKFAKLSNEIELLVHSNEINKIIKKYLAEWN